MNPTPSFGSPSAPQADHRAILSGTQSLPENSKINKVPGPETPIPTKAYIERAQEPPKRLPDGRSQPLLIVFDLNGTLLARILKKDTTSFVPRSNLTSFLDWLFDDDKQYGHQHRAMVWSSARPHNVKGMVDQLFKGPRRSQVVAVWSRDELGLTPQQYRNKVQVFKELNKVWADPGIAKTHPNAPVEHWDQTNTVLVDDSIVKASAEPFNLLEITEFAKDMGVDDALERAREYLEEASRWENVSAYMRTRPFKASGEEGVRLPC